MVSRKARRGAKAQRFNAAGQETRQRRQKTLRSLVLRGKIKIPPKADVSRKARRGAKAQRDFLIIFGP